MSDRTAFLNSIRESPDDDVPRLVFADWLDDNAESDCDTATAQFIRLGCSLDAKKKRQSREEGKFLQQNWQRLVPNLAAAGYKLNRRDGRDCTFTREERTPRSWTRWCLINFWRGFATHIGTYSVRDIRAVRCAAVTQPFASLHIADNAIVQYRDLWAEIRSRLFIHFSHSDVWDRIRGHDVVTDEEIPVLNEPTRHYSVKRWNRAGCVSRAEKALSDAIRSTVDSTPALA